MSVAPSGLRRPPSMDDDQSLGGAEPVLRKRTTHDIAEELKAPHELTQAASINKAPDTDSPRDGPPSPKRRKVFGASYSKPSHRSTRRAPANPGIGDFENADSFGSAPFSPSDHNLRDYNHRNLKPADLGGRSSKTTILNGAPGSKGALSSFDSSSHNLDSVRFDNDNSTEHDTAPLQPTVQPQRGRKSGRLMAAGNSYRRTLDPASFDNDKSIKEDAAPLQPQRGRKSGRLMAAGNSDLHSLNPVSFDDDGDSDTEDEDAVSSGLAAKIQSLREPESLTAIQLAAKAGLGGNSRLALLLKSRGRGDTVMVSRGGWSDYKPPKIPKLVVKRPRGRPRIHPEGQSNRSKKKSAANAGQQPNSTAHNSTAQSGVAETPSQELGSSASTAAGVVPSSNTRSMHLRSSSSIRLPARYSDVPFTSTTEPADLDDGSQGLERQQVSTLVVFSELPGKSVRQAEADVVAAGRSHTKRASGARPRRFGARRKSSAVKKSSEPIVRPYAGKKPPTMPVSESLPQDSQKAGKKVSADPELVASSQASQNGVPAVDAQPTRETRSRTLRNSTGPSSAARKSQDVLNLPDSVAPQGQKGQEPGNKVIATPKVSHPQASGSTTPATPEPRKLRQRPGDKVSLPQPKGLSKRKSNVKASTSALPATPSAQVDLSAQEKGWITRRAAQASNAGQSSAQKSGQKTAQKADQKKSSSVAAADTQPKSHRFSLREPKTPEAK